MIEERMYREVSVIDIVNKFIYFIRYIVSKWLFIVLIAFVFAVLGVLYAWIKKPLYIAEMTFTTETESSSKLGAYAGLAAQFGLDMGGGTNNVFEGENLVELLKSKNLVERTLLSPSTVAGKLMIDEYVDVNKIIERDDTKYKDVHFDQSLDVNSRVEDSILNVAYKKIVENGQLEVYKKEKKLSIIVVKMTSGNESFSQRFVQLLAQNAIQYYADYKTKKARQNVELLQRQTDSVRGMLFGGMADVAAITDLNVNPIKQASKAPVQRRQIDVQVNGQLYGELLKQLELSKITLRRETPLIQVIDTPILPLEKKKPGRLKSGILFGFMGGLLAILFLSFSRWYKSQQLQVTNARS
jgi:hypothetical protein